MKKPHVHLMMMFPGPKTRACVEKMLKPLGAVGCEALQSVRGYARYLCHLDDADKAQYQPDEVTAFGGVKYEDVIKAPVKESAVDVMCAIMEWCDENRCYSFATLMRYARKNRREWLDVLFSSRHSVIYRYLRSCEWEAGAALSSRAGAETGNTPTAAAQNNFEKPAETDRLASVRAQGLLIHTDGQTQLSTVDAENKAQTPWG